ncbi:enoyl-CoA hydratase/isomerase family protein [Streptomyces sp. NPDC059080]|uniref:enoyl-CoA hydratase/isomerase family protein n=1 Tax=Streptomyces sp. NPDC059080 TaxID=3346718 RepID=UPI0036A4CBF3
MTAADDSVLRRTEGRAGHLTLNRPRALNSLTHGMVRQLSAALDDWREDPGVATVVLSGAGERGLCAGGDIRAIHDDARDGDGAAARAFWRDEYRLNAQIARYPKPFVAFMDGIVMGGGVGVSAHGAVRIVTERSRIAMPETAIGFVPDVGGLHLLAAAPGELGTHLALTGAPMTAGDALLCGLADHFVPAARLPELAAGLATGDVAETVARYAEPAPAAELAAHRGWIDACYAAGTVEEIVDRLEHSGEPAAKSAAQSLRELSPTSLKVTLAALRRVRRLGSLERVLDQDYRIASAALASPDLVEGIRARIVDKDRSPRWSPARLKDVTDGEVARHFRSLGPGELGLADG